MQTLNVSAQIEGLLANEKLRIKINELNFGNVAFEIRKGRVYKILAVESILIDDDRKDVAQQA